jgi:preprotein translocase subunit SecE
MARMTTRRVDEDEDEVEDLIDEAEEAVEESSGPAVSDSRRRRQIKRGEVVESSTTTETIRKDRPVPPRIRPDDAQGGNVVTRFVGNIRDYWRETRAELDKVAWPSRDETQRLTVIVLIVTAASAAFLGLVSFLFSVLTTQIANPDTSLIVGILTIVLVLVVTGGWLLRERLFGTLD